MKKTILLLLLGFIGYYNVFAQDEWVSLDYATTNTGDNGLIGSYIYAIFEDSNNTLWIGTESGLSIKKDGEWSSMTKSEGLVVNEVGDILEDNNGNIWISYGSYVSGVSYFDGEQFHHLREEDGLIHDKVNSMYKDKEGNLWFATMEGVSKYDGENWKNITMEDGLTDNNITAILEDSKGNMWFGSQQDGISVFDGENWTYHVYFEGSSDNSISCIYEDSAGNIWTDGYGVNYFDGTEWTKLNTEDGLIHSLSKVITQDNKANIWIGTQFGLSKYNGSSFENYTTENNLPSNVIFSIFQDSKGVIHLGTDKGVAHFDGEYWTAVTSSNGLIHNDVWDIFQEENGALWFCTHEGLSRFENNNWTNYNSCLGKDIKWVSKGIQDSFGKLWFGTVHGLFGFDGTNWIHNTINDSWVQDIIEEEDGSLLLASSKGVFKFVPTTGELSIVLEGYRVNCILRDDDNVYWFGTQDGVIYVDPNGTFLFTVDDGLPSNNVETLIQLDSGQIFAGTDKGLANLQDEKWLVKDIYISSWIMDMYEDRNGIIWLAGNGGVTKFDGENNYFMWQAYDKLGEIAKCFYREENGNFWFGTEEGIVELIPDIELADVIVNDSNSKSNDNSLKIVAEGVTKPFQYSIDNGKNFEKNNGIFTGLVNGEYEVLITNAYDTLRVSNISIYATGINDPIGIPKDKLYPNPSNGVFHVESENVRIEVSDINGRIVLQDRIDGNNSLKIDISKYPKGLYFLTLFKESGELTKKIIVQ